jgi:hypothetical protein
MKLNPRHLNLYPAIFAMALSCAFAPSHAQAARLDTASMDENEKAQVEDFVNNEVRDDVQAHFKATIREVDEQATAERAEPMMMAYDGSVAAPPETDKLSPETRKVILKGMFLSVKAQGIPVDELYFNQKAGQALDYAQKLGVMPSAITMGYEVRVQNGIGGSLGTQWNFYLDHGILMLSSFTMDSVNFGTEVSATVGYSVSFCFGSCFGGAPAGYYIGVDGSISGGVGGGMYAEIGVDVTDLWKAYLGGKKYSLKELYQSRAVYIGWGFDVGFGGGTSFDLYYYHLDYERKLLNIGQKISPGLITGLNFKQP